MWESLSEVSAWVWRGSLYAIAVVLIIFLAQTLLRRLLSAQWRAALWLILLARLVLPAGPESSWSLWNLAPRFWPGGAASVSAVVAQPVAVVPPAGLEPGGGRATSPAPSAAAGGSVAWSWPDWPSLLPRLRLWLPGLWLAGALSLFAGMALVSLRLWLSVRRLDFVNDTRLLTLLEECKRQLRMRTMVGVVRSARVRSPFLFGFMRPRIVLPAGLELTPEQLRCVLLHELAHVKRGDILLGWLLAVLQALHWFNPFIWWAFARIRVDREAACDAMAMAVLPVAQRPQYGAALLGILERFNHWQHLPAVAGIMENKAQLKRRLIMITQYKQQKRRAGVPALALAALLCGGLLTEARDNASVTSQPQANGQPDAMSEPGNKSYAAIGQANFTAIQSAGDGQSENGARHYGEASTTNAFLPAEASHGGDYIIGVDDVLSIHVWKEENLSVPSISVRPDGMISVPRVNDIMAAGKTTSQLRDEIAGKLREYVNDEPAVTVDVLQVLSRTITVFGQDNRIIALSGPTTVLDALASGGGPTGMAKPKNIMITRVVNGKTRIFRFNYEDVISGKHNIYLQAGDTVKVS